MLVIWTLVVRIRTEHVTCWSVYSVHTHQLLSLKTKYQQNHFRIVPSIITYSVVYPLLDTNISRLRPLPFLSTYKTLRKLLQLEKIVAAFVMVCEGLNCSNYKLRLTSLFIRLNFWLSYFESLLKSYLSEGRHQYQIVWCIWSPDLLHFYVILSVWYILLLTCNIVTWNSKNHQIQWQWLINRSGLTPVCNKQQVTKGLFLTLIHSIIKSQVASVVTFLIS